MNLRNALVAGAFVILAVVAALGWTKAERGSTLAPQAVNYGQPVSITAVRPSLGTVPARTAASAAAPPGSSTRWSLSKA